MEISIKSFYSVTNLIYSSYSKIRNYLIPVKCALSINSNNYNKIKIQDLPDSTTNIEHFEKIESEEMWKMILCKINKCNKNLCNDPLKIKNNSNDHPSDRCNCKIIKTIQNKKMSISSGDGFFDAFYFAYANHDDVKITPDDVWLTIYFNFCKYVNANGEKIRYKITDKTTKDLIHVACLDNMDWDHFFDKIYVLFERNTKNDFVKNTNCDFTTTSQTEYIIYNFALISTLKKYFNYSKYHISCGIRNIYMGGTLEDWKSVLEKLIFLKKYDVDNILIKYVDDLVPIIKKFIDTYNGRTDVDFWNQIIDKKYRGYKNGLSSLNISGWLLLFFIDCKTKEEYTYAEIHMNILHANIMENICKKNKKINVIGGFAGVHVEKYNDTCPMHIYSPQLSMSLVSV